MSPPGGGLPDDSPAPPPPTASCPSPYRVHTGACLRKADGTVRSARRTSSGVLREGSGQRIGRVRRRDGCLQCPIGCIRQPSDERTCGEGRGRPGRFSSRVEGGLEPIERRDWPSLPPEAGSGGGSGGKTETRRIQRRSLTRTVGRSAGLSVEWSATAQPVGTVQGIGGGNGPGRKAHESVAAAQAVSRLPERIGEPPIRRAQHDADLLAGGVDRRRRRAVAVQGSIVGILGEDGSLAEHPPPPRRRRPSSTMRRTMAATRSRYNPGIHHRPFSRQSWSRQTSRAMLPATYSMKRASCWGDSGDTSRCAWLERTARALSL